MTGTPLQFGGQIAIGHFLRLCSQDSSNNTTAVKYGFQNFYFGQSKTLNDPAWGAVTYTFVPFGFSGTSTSKNGDVEPATLMFANDQEGLARSFISEALRGQDIDVEDPEAILLPYLAQVDVILIDVETEQQTKLYTYTGQCSSAGWGDTEATLELGSILDAVGGDLPTRTLRKDLVGNLPTSPRIRVR